jgi:hypothetical protein
MDPVEESGRALPLYVSLPTIAIATMVMLLMMRRLPSVAARFVLFAVWLRVILGALHEFSFDPSPVGLSWNALASVAAAGLGLLLIRRRRLFNPALTPFLLLFPVMIASGFGNGEVASLTTALTKYVYLLVLILAVVDAADDVGPDRLFGALLVPFALVIALQLLSLVLGVAKAGESDGSASYLGGFYHEAAFSVTLAAGVLAVGLIRKSLMFKFTLIFVGLISILLANYRTAILAVLPFVAMVVLTDVPRRFVARQRAAIVGLIALVVVSAGFVGAIAGSERFADLGAAARGEITIVQRPELFAEEDRHILSGRPEIWSGYVYGWIDADGMRRLIGFGPEAWTNYFKLYAHNTLVSTLFEMGLLGVFAMLFLWFWMLGLALLARGGPRLELAAGHVAFLILNMATMPMWMIEGMIFYGLLCGYTVWAYERSRAVAPPSPTAIGPAARAI